MQTGGAPDCNTEVWGFLPEGRTGPVEDGVQAGPSGQILFLPRLAGADMQRSLCPVGRHPGDEAHSYLSTQLGPVHCSPFPLPCARLPGTVPLREVQAWKLLPQVLFSGESRLREGGSGRKRSDFLRRQKMKFSPRRQLGQRMNEGGAEVREDLAGGASRRRHNRREASGAGP